jgi:hypothetical protein
MNLLIQEIRREGRLMGIRVILSAVILLTFFSTFGYALDCNGGRYEDNGDGTVTDCKSGLIWLKNTDCWDTVGGITKINGFLTWTNARKWTAALADGKCSLTDGSAAGDWRLSTKSEFMAMVDSARSHTPAAFTNPAMTDASGTTQCLTGCIFDNLISSYYWSSTTDPSDIANAYVLYMNDGTTTTSSKTGNQLFVWPVRGGQAGSFGSLTIQ